MSKNNAWPRCPHLGLVDDRVLYCTFPNEAHRCYRGGRGVPVSWNKQELLCLSEGYAACPVDHGPSPKRIGRLRQGPYLAALAGVLLLAMLLLAWARSYFDVALTDVEPAGVSSAAQSSAPVEVSPTAADAPPVPDTPAALSVLPTATEPPAATAQPMATAQPTATAATLTPTALQGSPRVHVVAPGETLSTIAPRYGATVDALARANGIADRNFIWYGQRLVIP